MGEPPEGSGGETANLSEVRRILLRSGVTTWSFDELFGKNDGPFRIGSYSHLPLDSLWLLRHIIGRWSLKRCLE